MMGPNTHVENHPAHVQQVLGSGLHAEVDVRLPDHTWSLGHDHAQYEVDVEFLLQPGLWLHAKDHKAAFALSALKAQHDHLNFFWHDTDTRVLTSQGYWWSLTHHELGKGCVAVMPEWCMSMPDLIAWSRVAPCAGICTDYLKDILR